MPLSIMLGGAFQFTPPLSALFQFTPPRGGRLQMCPKILETFAAKERKFEGILSNF